MGEKIVDGGLKDYKGGGINKERKQKRSRKIRKNKQTARS